MKRHARFVMLALAWSLVGCAAERPPPTSSAPQSKFVESGFLSDYSVLTPSNDPQRALLLYRNPSADLSRYDKLLFERVTIWVEKEKEREEIATEDFQRLADDMYHALRTALERDYRLVGEPGPGVLRIHLGLTYVSNPEAQNDVFLSVASDEPPGVDEAPLGRAIEAFVNNANIEAEVADAASHETLFAAVDPWTRQTPLQAGSVKTWKEVHEALAFWAARIRTRLAEARRGQL